MSGKVPPTNEMGHPPSSADAPPPLTSGEIAERILSIMDEANDTPNVVRDDVKRAIESLLSSLKQDRVFYLCADCSSPAACRQRSWCGSNHPDKGHSSLKLSGGSAAQVPPPVASTAEAPSASAVVEACAIIAKHEFHERGWHPYYKQAAAAIERSILAHGLARAAALSPKEPTDG